MGLCKCPKRKVTTQFCYEHRVNVCEHCVVINHPKCVVQSYLLWLQDSDYSPQCTLCKRNLSDDECARLSCYHVYHWDCLDQHVRDLPETTAPAGYKCPSCSESILPKQNSASPVADALREKLSTVNWGRIGLGLPLFYRVVTTFRSDLRIFMLTIVANILLAVIWSTVCSRLPSPIYTPRQKYRNTYETLVKQSTEDIIKPPKKSSPKSPALMNSLNDKQNIVNPEGIVVHVEENLHIRPESSAQVPRRNPHGVIGEKIVLLDEDENKYRRRYGFLRLSLWFKFLQNQMNFSKKGPRGACKLIFFIVILFSLTCVIFSVLGNVMTQDDPAFDVHNDPNNMNIL